MQWIWLGPVILAAYLQRFAVSWWLVAHHGAARFDPHAFGLLGDAVILLALAPVLLAVLWWVRRRPWRGLFARASSPAWTAVSVAVLTLAGAPMPGQVWALVLLPLADAWPVLLSALAWFMACAVLRALAAGGPARPVARHPAS